MAVALVVAAIGIFGFASHDFVAIGCVIIVLASLIFAVMLGIGPDEGEKQPDRPKNDRPNVS